MWLEVYIDLNIWFLDEIKIYLLIDFILKLITFVYIAFLVHFCMLMIKQLPDGNLVQCS